MDIMHRYSSIIIDDSALECMKKDIDTLISKHLEAQSGQGNGEKDYHVTHDNQTDQGAER
jgi:hypothetical protein